MKRFKSIHLQSPQKLDNKDDVYLKLETQYEVSLLKDYLLILSLWLGQRTSHNISFLG